jgi:hypothetical protein
VRLVGIDVAGEPAGDQARTVARRRLRSVEHSMLPENQSVPAKDFEARIDALARDLTPRALWDDA